MGDWRPRTANPNESETGLRIREKLADAIRDRLARDPTVETVIRRHVKSCRPAVLNDIKQGVGSMYGITRLSQICEAMGLQGDLYFRSAP